MITLFQGDDTGGTFGRLIQIKIDTPSSQTLAGCTAEFIFDGITKSWTNITPGQYVELFYSHNETSSMALGQRCATFRIVDSAGKIRTFDNKIPVCVTNRVERVYPGSSQITIVVGGTIHWEEIIGPFKQTDIFDMNCSDWEFRKRLAKVWEALGGKVINND